MKPTKFPYVDYAALLALEHLLSAELPELPVEVRQKMARLLARMLNEYSLHRPTVAEPEVGDE
jgi:hypothetical protein